MKKRGLWKQFLRGVGTGLLVTGLFLLIGFLVDDSQAGPEGVRVKGFYIGMTIDEAKTNLERLGFKEVKIFEREFMKGKAKSLYYQISLADLTIETDLDTREVTFISILSSLTDRLFNTRGIHAEVFQREFMEAYGIPGMEPYMKDPNSTVRSGWEYANLKHGYRIRITHTKDIEMVRTARRSEFRFD